MEARDEIAALRKVIKARCKTLSVTCGRGTAWGWVDVRGSGEHGMFTAAENAALTELGLAAGGNYAVISPERRSFFLKRWTGLGEGRRCLVCREPATSEFFCPCDLTHFTCEAHKNLGDCARAGRL